MSGSGVGPLFSQGTKVLNKDSRKEVRRTLDVSWLSMSSYVNMYVYIHILLYKNPLAIYSWDLVPFPFLDVHVCPHESGYQPVDLGSLCACRHWNQYLFLVHEWVLGTHPHGGILSHPRYKGEGQWLWWSLMGGLTLHSVAKILYFIIFCVGKECLNLLAI